MNIERMYIYTLVMKALGNDIPIRNPKAIPKMAEKISLLLSFDFFRTPL